MNKLIPIAIVAAIIIGFIGWTIPKIGNQFGGTTADNWNVGGNLAVTGTSALTGALTQTGAATLSSTLTVTGESNLTTVVYGGSETDVSTSTAKATTTLTAAQFCDSAKISWSPFEKVASTSWPAATAIVADCLTADGDEKVVIFNNATTTAGSTIVFATTSTDLATGTFLFFPYTASSTDTGAGGNRLLKALTLDPLDWLEMTIHRVSATEVRVLLERIIPYK